MKFSKNLQDLRNSKGMSQEQLADKIGVSRQSIGAWESGKTLPEIDKVAEICKIFGVSADELLGEISKKSAGEFSKTTYDKENLQISIMKASGVAAILFGVAAMFSTAGENDLGFSNAIFIFIGVIISLPFFIIGNSLDENLKSGLKNNIESAKNLYSDAEIAKFNLRKAIFSASGIILILAGVLMNGILANFKVQENLTLGAMMSAVTVGVWLLIFGAQNDKIAKIADAAREKNPKLEKFFALLWTLTVSAYLLFGFLGGMWSKAWVIFPISAMISVVASILFDNKK